MANSLQVAHGWICHADTRRRYDREAPACNGKNTKGIGSPRAGYSPRSIRRKPPLNVECHTTGLIESLGHCFASRATRSGRHGNGGHREEGRRNRTNPATNCHAPAAPPVTDRIDIVSIAPSQAGQLASAGPPENWPPSAALTPQACRTGCRMGQSPWTTLHELRWPPAPRRSRLPTARHVCGSVLRRWLDPNAKSRTI